MPPEQLFTSVLSRCCRYTILMKKYEALQGLMLRVQNFADDLATALEKMQARCKGLASGTPGGSPYLTSRHL